MEVAERLGTSLAAGDVKRGLQEINPQISFDAPVERPSEYRYAMSTAGEWTAIRGGVYYNGLYVCAMDRDMIPEKEVWEMADGLKEIPMTDIERHDSTRVIYLEVLPSDPAYNEALLKAERGDDNYQLDGDGKVFRYRAVMEGKVPFRPIRLGWRHTFGKLVAKRVVTPDQIYKKFRVRL